MIDESVKSNYDELIAYLELNKEFIADPEKSAPLAKELVDKFKLEDIITFINSETMSNPTFSVGVAIDFVHTVEGIVRDLVIVTKNRRQYYSDAVEFQDSDLEYKKIQMDKRTKYLKGGMPIQGVANG